MAGTKDIVEQALKLVTGGGEEAAKTGIRAYHGSPHDFDKFDMSKIGTGEGAQAYGHGLYFADREGIAKSYRDALSPKNYLLNAPEPEIAQKYGQDVLDMFSSHGGDPNEIKDTISRLSEQNKRDLYDLGVSDVSQVRPQNNWGIEANLVNRADRLNRLQSLLASQDVKINPGHMYEVNIAADPNTFLDWDKPLSEQPEAVRQAYVKAVSANDPVLSELLDTSPEGMQMMGLFPRSTGAQAYNTFVENNKDAATKALREAGIPGIKYLDAGSRSAGEGTRNYVVFDDKLISIIRKYGIAGASAMLGYNLMENLDANQALAATMADQDYQASAPQKAGGGAVRDGYAGRGRVGGDIVDQALKLVTGEGEEAAKTGIRAYQGSPHNFAAERLVRFPEGRTEYIVGQPDVLPDVPQGAEVVQDFPLGRMRMDKIGTGEGAQAYGHGLYLAEHEPVATGYRRSLAGPESMGTVTFDGRPIVSGGSPAEGWNDPNLILGGSVHARDLAETMLRHNGNVDAAVSELRERSQSGLERAQAIKNEKLRQMAIDSAKTTSDMADLLQANPNRYGVKVPGHTYEVNIAADPNTFLDWDKPLSEQPQNVLDVARPFFSEGLPERKQYGEIVKGGDLYDMLTKRSGGVMHSPKLDAAGIPNQLPGGTKERLGMYLSSQGIPGIKYLDAGSRGAGEGTRNYVVFDDKLISIIRKYGIAGASAMLGYNLMENLDPKQALAATMADKDYQASAPQKADGGAVREGYAGKGRVVGDIVDQALKLITDEGEKAAQKGIRVYHGSPHKFDEFRFTPREIGSGEGAQAYGYGGYFAESEPLAESYTKARDWSYKGKSAQDIYDDLYKISRERNLDNEGWSKLNAQRGFWERVLTGRSPRSIIMEGKINPDDYGASDLAYHRTLDPSKFVRNEGHMYEVGINSDPSAFVDWDKLISEQPEAFREYMRDQLKKQGYLRAKENGPRQLNSALKAWNMEKGSMLDTPIQSIIMGRGEIGGGTPVGVSKDLQSLGLPGVKFLDSQSRGLGTGTRNYVVFPGNEDLVNIIRSYADGGAVDEDDDVNDALRIAKQEGGILMEDAKGNKYDAQGNLIPPTAPGPNPARTDAPQAVAQRAVSNPATYDALMEYYAVPDRDIADYEATKAAVAAQPRETQQMTHVGAKPRREVTVDMPLFGGEYSMGTAPYDVASGMSGVAQTAYDLKTAPFYAVPFTAPIAAGMDLAEGLSTNDPLTASLAIGFGPGSKYAKAAGIGAVNYFMDPSQAEAGPARWFSKAVDAARNIPMNKMTGDQALAMLRKGVSPEELKWIGADRFLPGEESITKQGLIDYLEKNRVGTKDVVLGGNKPTRLADVKVEDIPAEIRQKYEPKINELMEKKTRANLAARGIKQSLGGDPTNPLHLKDQTYLSLLQDGIDYNGEIIDLHEAMKQEYVDSIGGLGEPVRYGPGSRYGEQYMTRGGEDYRETLITLPASEYGNLYQSGHWEGIPNVVGHIRTQVLDVTPPGSNRPYKAFNVDEAQSDYAKSGREKGFINEQSAAIAEKLRKENQELEAKIAAEQKRIYDEHRQRLAPVVEARDKFEEELYQMQNRGEITPREAERRLDQYLLKENSQFAPLHQRYRSEHDAILKPMQEKLEANRLELAGVGKKIGSIPTAPYVTSTQNWTDLSIKKALDQALDAGADYFTYTPGEVQANRYGLSEDLQSIAYDPVSNTLEYMPKTGGWNAVPQKVPPEKLPEYIGKEMAEKLMAQEGQYVGGAYKKKVLENDDLKLGGHGMRDYYDNIYKKRVEKVVKDATGQKVQWEVIPVQTADGPREQLGFRLTDDFQNARFSDFNKGGRVTGRGKYADSDAVGRALALTSEV